MFLQRISIVLNKSFENQFYIEVSSDVKYVLHYVFTQTFVQVRFLDISILSFSFKWCWASDGATSNCLREGERLRESDENERKVPIFVNNKTAKE